jgi:hypothetical protein
MKTDELINALVQDAHRTQRSIAALVLSATLLGGLVSGVLFALVLGVRPDLADAMETWRFLFKFGLCVICLTCTWFACVEMARPEARLHNVVGWLAIAPMLLAVAVSYELVSVPSAYWYDRAAGNYARVCMIAIPLLSIVPLAALLMALRQGAPRVPASAGAICGLLAGSSAAAIYATHCPDDSPLFVGLWYTLAVGLVTLSGALAGRRLLRW